MESLDDLLSQIKAEYTEKTPNPSPKSSPLIEEYKRQAHNNASPYSVTPTQPNLPDLTQEYSLISELKAEFAATEQAEKLKQEEQIKVEKIRQEQLQKERRQGLEKKAQEWLKQLNPHSQEGLWFEEFAYKYASKLDAAIDYLQVLSTDQNV
ncbi:salt stress protein, Slr1339 family, partial [Merismopedia glauca]